MELLNTNQEELQGTVRRLGTVSQVTVIPNSLLLASEIGFQAKGILSYLLCRCGVDGWQIRVNDILGNTAESKNSVVKAMKELRKNGYAFLERTRNPKTGRLKDNYIISDTPVVKWITSYENYAKHRSETSKKAYETQLKKGNFKIKREKAVNEDTANGVGAQPITAPAMPLPQNTHALGNVLQQFGIAPATEKPEADDFVTKSFNIYSFYMMNYFNKSASTTMKSKNHRENFALLLEAIKEESAAKNEGIIDEMHALLTLTCFLAIVPPEYVSSIGKFMPGLLLHDFNKILIHSRKKFSAYLEQGRVVMPSFMKQYFEEKYINS